MPLQIARNAISFLPNIQFRKLYINNAGRSRLDIMTQAKKLRYKQNMFQAIPTFGSDLDMYKNPEDKDRHSDTSRPYHKEIQSRDYLSVVSQTL